MNKIIAVLAASALLSGGAEARLSKKVRARAPPAKAAAAAPLATFAPNDPSLYYSPYQWQVSGSAASTINSAAYVRFLFSGTQLSFTFNVSNMCSSISEVYWRVDNGPATHSLVLPSVSVAIPPNNTLGDVPYHNVELFVKSTTEGCNRWSATGTSTRVILTGIVTDGKLAQWFPSDANVLIYGDSITEGVLCLGGSQKLDTDHNDGSVVYSYSLARLLGAEIGVVGFGATGLSRGGSGGVPALGVSWNQLWDGVPRSFSPKPDLILFSSYRPNSFRQPPANLSPAHPIPKPGIIDHDLNTPNPHIFPADEGTNDGSNNITAQMAVVLQNLIAACPGTPIVVMLPFNGAEAASLQAAIAAVGSADVHYLDTTGFYDMSMYRPSRSRSTLHASASLCAALAAARSARCAAAAATAAAVAQTKPASQKPPPPTHPRP